MTCQARVTPANPLELGPVDRGRVVPEEPILQVQREDHQYAPTPRPGKKTHFAKRILPHPPSSFTQVLAAWVDATGLVKV